MRHSLAPARRILLVASLAFGFMSSPASIQITQAAVPLPATNGMNLCAKATYNSGFRATLLTQAAAICYAESSGDPSQITGSYYGLFQINPNLGYNTSCLLNAQCNSDAAHTIRLQQGDWCKWQSWSGAGCSNAIAYDNHYAQWLTSAATAISKIARYGDIDGGGVADYALWRDDNHWFVDTDGVSGSNFSPTFGSFNNDYPVPADWNGDGKIDIATWRIADHYWRVDVDHNGTNDTAFTFGSSADEPVPGDYNGDGSVDPALWRPSDKYFRIDTDRNGTSDIAVSLGASTDIPVIGDFNRDGKTDCAVFRPSTGYWYIDTDGAGSAPLISVHFGAAGDIPVPGDYNNDGRDDLAVYRQNTGVWSVDTTLDGTFDIQDNYGASTDIPQPGDYDGDGTLDFALFRPTGSTPAWFVDTDDNNSGNITNYFGATDDLPVTYWQANFYH